MSKSKPRFLILSVCTLSLFTMLTTPLFAGGQRPLENVSGRVSHYSLSAEVLSPQKAKERYDVKAGVSLLMEAAQSDTEVAILIVGSGMCYNMHLNKDISWFKNFMSSAAKDGQVEALFYMSLLKLWENDLQKGMEYFYSARAKESAMALYICGVAEMADEQTSNDIEAFQKIKKAADKNILEAQLVLSVCYITGKGTNKNVNRSYHYLKKAADWGSVNAENIISKVSEDRGNLLELINTNININTNNILDFPQLAAFATAYANASKNANPEPKPTPPPPPPNPNANIDQRIAQLDQRIQQLKQEIMQMGFNVNAQYYRKSNELSRLQNEKIALMHSKLTPEQQEQAMEAWIKSKVDPSPTFPSSGGIANMCPSCKGRKKCPLCNGSGKYSNYGTTSPCSCVKGVCGVCNGSGKCREETE